MRAVLLHTLGSVVTHTVNIGPLIRVQRNKLLRGETALAWVSDRNIKE